MPIRLYNSLTKRKEEFIPLHPPVVKMYTCGVTVYDRCHIGHARSLYVFDVIRRYLRFRGFQVEFVRNITDVDDKIIQRAAELKISSAKLASDEIRAYQEDLKRLGVSVANIEPKATDNIPEMVRHIEGLIKKGTAYVADGDVYFSVRNFKDYGKLSGQAIEMMQEAVRIDKDAKKKDPLDFALWKKSKDGDPAWDSPWGPGRPGWHLECSVMSMKHLHTETLDIHAGGRDLIFPHHENEIAQSEALTHKPFARYWIHHGLLTTNGQKMSKSLGNFMTIQDAVQKYPVDCWKMLFLFSHYASPLDYTEAKMAETKKALDRFDILFWKAAEIVKAGADVIPVEADFVKTRKREFLEAMDDDFNTPEALAALFHLVSDTHKFMEDGKTNAHYIAIIRHSVDTLANLGKEIFGLFEQEPQLSLKPEDAKLIEERAQARKKKDFKRSDDLRDTLRGRGIAVEDTKDGQTWRWI